MFERGGPVFFSGIHIMEIKIHEDAQKWFENELGISDGRGVRFLGKVYGETTVHEGFSLAIEVTEPGNTLALVEINNIPYFVDANDEWFFGGYDLEVKLSENHREPEYIFHATK